MHTVQPTFDDITAAAGRLSGRAVHTPLLESPLLNDCLGGRLLVKAEPLQRTGSFKYRGAFNRMSLIPDADRARGVVAFSSGNHAQGVAAAARDLGMRAIIVMPADAPAIKIRNTRSWGAEVVLYDRYTQSREAIGNRIAAQTGATLIKPFDDPHVIAGQGTVGLELAIQAAERGVVPDAVLVPCSGGGLVAGTALAITHLCPGVTVYAAEPAGLDDTGRSLAAGRRLSNDPHNRSICDALMAPMPGEITFAVNRRLLAGGVAANDQEIRQAMATAFAYFKLVVEPGGSAGLAAVLAGHVPCQGRTIAVVCSGGNVDPAIFAEALA